MNESLWHYKLFSEEFGPVTPEEIFELVTSGTLGPKDPVRRQGTEEWISVSQMSATESATGPSELTDLSELSFSFEDNAPERARFARKTDSFQLADEPPPEPDAGPEFYVETLGQVLGPLSMEELVQMTDSGALTSRDKIREGLHGDWLSPGDFSEIATAIAKAEASQTGPSTTGATTARRLQPDVPVLNPTEVLPPDREPPTEAFEDAPDAAPADSGVATSQPSRSKKSSGAKQKNPRKKKKRRKEKKQDEFLKEIFSEVFTEDGKVREESDRAVGSPAGNADTSTVVPAMRETPAADTSSNRDVPAASISPAAATPIAPVVPAVMAPPAQPAVSPAKPAWQPPPKKKSGGGFQMPEPKVLGGIAGVAVIGLLLFAFFTGKISLPGGAVDVGPALRGFGLEYTAMSAQGITESEWSGFASRVKSATKQISTQLAAKKSLSADEKKYRAAALKYAELSSCTVAQEEMRKEIFAAVLDAMSGK